MTRPTCARGIGRAPHAAMIAACVLALAACGSAGGPSPQAGGVGQGALVKFAACVRDHGVPGFPDPSTRQGSNSMGIDGYSFNLPSNVDLQAPAYQSASRACGSLLGGNGGGGPVRNPAFLAKARQRGLSHARCMRQHGVPNFPDPIFHSGGGGVTVTSGGRGLNPRSPAFQAAQKACGPG